MSDQSRPKASPSTHQEDVEELIEEEEIEEAAGYRNEEVLDSLLSEPEKLQLHPPDTWESCLNPLTMFYTDVIGKGLSSYVTNQNFDYGRRISSGLYPPHILTEMANSTEASLEQVKRLENLWATALQKTVKFFQDSPMSRYAAIPPPTGLVADAQQYLASNVENLDGAAGNNVFQNQQEPLVPEREENFIGLHTRDNNPNPLGNNIDNHGPFRQNNNNPNQRFVRLFDANVNNDNNYRGSRRPSGDTSSNPGTSYDIGNNSRDHGNNHGDNDGNNHGNRRGSGQNNGGERVSGYGKRKYR